MANMSSYDFAPSRKELDDWFYKTSIDPSDFGPMLAHVPHGQRSIHRIKVGEIFAYRKWDATLRGKTVKDGARDKVASDLAQIAAVNVPATVLWVDKGEFGCLQKEPTNFTQTLKSFMAACEVDPDGHDEAIAYLADAYDPMNFYLDIWVGNADRQVNYSNTLLTETSTVLTLWVIDFNCSLGHKERPWGDVHKGSHGFGSGEVPIPMVIMEHAEWTARLRKEADNLQKRLDEVSDDEIDKICDRAFGFYDDEDYNTAYEHIAEVLKARRGKVRQWADQLLTL